MRDRVSTKILDNGAVRYGVYDETGQLLRYEYIKLEDEPDVEGTLLNKANLLTDETAAALGLESADPTVNEAFRQISTPQAGTGTLYVYCKDEAGAPVSGCVVQIGEELAVTGASGAVKYFLAPGSYSVAIRSPIDYGAESQTVSVTVALSEIASAEATIQDSLGGVTEAEITSSLTAAFSNRVVSADVFGVGGGGSGAYANAFSSNYPLGVASGGAGGKTATKMDILTTDIFQILIGSGGAPVSQSGYKQVDVSGNKGGTTSVKTSDGEIILSAPGGGGGAGKAGYGGNHVSGASGGSGSGGASTTGPEVGEGGVDGTDGGDTSGASGGTGQGTSTRAFGDTDGKLFASAGGSVAVYFSAVVGSCGPGGGQGVGVAFVSKQPNELVFAHDATTPGSGGGAAVISTTNSNAGSSYGIASGAGADGIVIFRWEVAA